MPIIGAILTVSAKYRASLRNFNSQTIEDRYQIEWSAAGCGIEAQKTQAEGDDIKGFGL